MAEDNGTGGSVRVVRKLPGFDQLKTLPDGAGAYEQAVAERFRELEQLRSWKHPQRIKHDLGNGSVDLFDALQSQQCIGQASGFKIATDAGGESGIEGRGKGSGIRKTSRQVPLHRHPLEGIQSAREWCQQRGLHECVQRLPLRGVE